MFVQVARPFSPSHELTRPCSHPIRLGLTKIGDAQHIDVPAKFVTGDLYSARCSFAQSRSI